MRRVALRHMHRRERGVVERIISYARHARRNRHLRQGGARVERRRPDLRQFLWNRHVRQGVATVESTIPDGRHARRDRHLRQGGTAFEHPFSDFRQTIPQRHVYEGGAFLERSRSNARHATWNRHIRQGAAFKGFYLQAYGNIGLYGICFDERRGWVGEGIGGGIGCGYVMPISKKGHWRMEFQLQLGVFHTKYDPYQFENAIDPTFHDNLYYYDWTRHPSLFKERQYRFTWIGPTRIGVTLSYDLLYRKAREKKEGWLNPKDTKPTKRYNRLVPYEKGGRQ